MIMAAGAGKEEGVVVHQDIINSVDTAQLNKVRPHCCQLLLCTVSCTQFVALAHVACFAVRVNQPTALLPM
jgi:hypothetical protein